MWTVPNILTLGRVLAAPCVALAFVVFERPLADWVAFWLFVVAGLTDFLDGWLARRLGQESEIGKMLDPIADKAMVIIALMVLFLRDAAVPPVAVAGALWQAQTPAASWLVLPAVVIALRETLVSGLREYLGDVKLRVTRLAKWKTTVQMVAIALLLGVEPLREVLSPGALRMADADAVWQASVQAGYAHAAGVALLWLAALLTAITGWDYFRKGLAYIREREDM